MDTPPLPAERSLSLDIIRGLTMACMIIVNNAGGPSTYPSLRHAHWNGWTLTDLIYPFFVFVMGVAVTYAFSRRHGSGENRSRLILHILRRTLMLFAIGVILSFNPDRDLAHWRVMGVLQRLALVYLAVSLLVLTTTVRSQVLALAASVGIYWALMKLVPVPGFGPGDLSLKGNLAAWIDNRLIPGHLHRPHWDPEGLLHTLPTVATALLGVLSGHWLRRKDHTLPEKSAGLFTAGSLSVLAGLLINLWFPINKNLWSPSFVLFTGGLAMNLYAASLWFADIRRIRKPFMPFVVLGMNSLFAYVVSTIFAGLFSILPVEKSGGDTIMLKEFLYRHAFASWAGPVNGSLFYSLSYCALWISIAAILYKRKIFIRL